MLSRRNWFIAISSAAFYALLGSNAQAVEEPTLTERLELGLKVRTTSERAYIARVVDLVNSGDLSQKLVDRVFIWSRKKAKKKSDSKRRRPMVYFQPALTKLAKRMGVVI